jgi:hypothetical protein
MGNTISRYHGNLEPVYKGQAHDFTCLLEMVYRNCERVARVGKRVGKRVAREGG